jgi:hypothetical protein
MPARSWGIIVPTKRASVTLSLAALVRARVTLPTVETTPPNTERREASLSHSWSMSHGGYE